MAQRNTRRQRLAAAALESAPPPSLLAQTLEELVGWGSISAVCAQKVSQAAASDGLTHPDVEALASCGSHGRNPQNTHRDMFAYLAPQINMPQPDIMRIPLLVDNEVQVLPYPIMSPLKVIAALRSEYPNLWAEVSGSSRLVSWWSQQDFTNPKLHNHPMLRRDS